MNIESQRSQPPQEGIPSNEEHALVKTSYQKREGEADLMRATIEGLSNMLVEARKRGENVAPVMFGDVRVSIQAGIGHYSEPRSNDAKAYTHVELGFPTKVPPEYILQYAENKENPTRTVYAYVPIEEVARWAAEESQKAQLSQSDSEGM